MRILQFADDMVLVGTRSWANLWSIKAIFRGFGLISGLKVNFCKSKIFGINVPEDFLNRASQFLCCSRDILPFKFLGIFVGLNPRRCNSWTSVVCNLKQKLSTWKARMISIGGWVTLLNSVLSNIPVITMSFYRAAIKIIK